MTNDIYYEMNSPAQREEPTKPRMVSIPKVSNSSLIAMGQLANLWPLIINYQISYGTVRDRTLTAPLRVKFGRDNPIMF